MSICLQPGKLDLICRKGITFGPITLSLDDENGADFDLTGYSVFAEVKTAKGAGAVFLNLSPTVSNATAGQISISLTDTQTAALTAGTYGWDLVIENASGERTGPILQGEFEVEEIYTTHA